MTKQILHIDIETSPHIAYVWGTTKQYITAQQMINESRVLCFAAKWDGHKKVHFHENFSDDDGGRELAKKAWKLLDEAAIVVHYNGTNFDMPRLRRMFVEHDLGPPSPWRDIDLYATVRSGLWFASKRLGSVGPTLGLGKKMETGGFDLWAKVLAGDAQAQALMRRYNIQDVLLQEGLYHKLRPWIKTHPSIVLDGRELSEPTCPKCGGVDIQWRGYYTTQVGKYRRFQCKTCGGWSRGRKTEVRAEERENILAPIAGS